MSQARVAKTVGSAVPLVLVAAFPLLTDSASTQNLLILALMLAIGASAVNVMAGYAGYYSLGEAAPFGVGAYAVAILTAQFGGSPLVWLPAAMASAAVVALVVGAIAARGRGDTFVILTMAGLFLIGFVATQWESLTEGPAGLTVPPPTWPLEYANWPFYYILLVALAGVLLLSWWIRRSKLGMGLLAIRDDEDRAASVGINVNVYKVLGFISSAMILGLVGGLWAFYTGFVNPVDAFSIVLSGQLLLAVLLGGKGTLLGPVVGGLLLTGFDYYGNLAFGGGNARLFIVGGLFVLVTLLLPDGIVPSLRKISGRLRLARRSERKPDEAAHRATEPMRLSPIAAADGRRSGATSPILAVRGLAKRFGGIEAIRGCDFEVEPGSITALIGPNGSGKTTVFNLVDGTIRQDAGEVWFYGERIDALPAWRRTHRGLARTFQTTRLFDEMSVLENVVAPLSEFRWSHLARDAISGDEAAGGRELLSLVGLTGEQDTLAGELSHGERKLVEIAQAMALRPTLIMLDEPAGGLNPPMAARLAALIQELNTKTGMTFLIVEHNMAFIMGLSHHVLVLTHGSVVCTGTPAEVKADPRVRDAYLGTATLGAPSAV